MENVLAVSQETCLVTDGRMRVHLLRQIFCGIKRSCIIAAPFYKFTIIYGENNYEEGLISLCEKYSHVDVIPVTSMHKAILEKKRYYDMTGNNVNHPNDFMARIYAQTVNKVILG